MSDDIVMRIAAKLAGPSRSDDRNYADAIAAVREFAAWLYEEHPYWSAPDIVQRLRGIGK